MMPSRARACNSQGRSIFKSGHGCIVIETFRDSAQELGVRWGRERGASNIIIIVIINRTIIIIM
eukprot:6736728-Karenia_brevis.AAC.1